MTDKPTHLTVEQSRVVIDALRYISNKRNTYAESLREIKIGQIDKWSLGYSAGVNECASLADGALQYLERVTDDKHIT
jgi:hypothetical protein